jgi:hypothetical protein
MKTWFLVFAVLAAALVVGCGGSTWKEFTPSHGHFRVLLPGTPSGQDEQEETPAGLARGKRFLAWTGAGGTDRFHACAVSYIDYTEGYTRANSPESIFAAQKAALVPSEGRLLSERAIEIGGSPGIELELEDPAGKVLFLRIYLVERRLFVVTAKYTRGRRPPEVDTFLESFRLTSD